MLRLLLPLHTVEEGDLIGPAACARADQRALIGRHGARVPARRQTAQ